MAGPEVNLYHRLFWLFGRSFRLQPIDDAPSWDSTAYNVESFDKFDDQHPLLLVNQSSGMGGLRP
jgi:hypothetical protein